MGQKMANAKLVATAPHKKAPDVQALDSKGSLRTRHQPNKAFETCNMATSPKVWPFELSHAKRVPLAGPKQGNSKFAWRKGKKMHGILGQLYVDITKLAELVDITVGILRGERCEQ